MVTTMSFPAASVANEFIELGKKNDQIVDPLKLQKLVYLAHGWHLAFLNQPLIKENVKAWRYGPVIPSIYKEFKDQGRAPILRTIEIPSGTPVPDANAKAIVDEVWKKYGRMSGFNLSMITHQPGSAWDIVRSSNSGGFASPPIPDSYIREEFKHRMPKG
jgi:uncharacterized phage-associated protein